jgi:hypothetical protein
VFKVRSFKGESYKDISNAKILHVQFEGHLTPIYWVLMGKNQIVNLGPNHFFGHLIPSSQLQNWKMQVDFLKNFIIIYWKPNFDLIYYYWFCPKESWFLLAYNLESISFHLGVLGVLFFALFHHICGNVFEFQNIISTHIFFWPNLGHKLKVRVVTTMLWPWSCTNLLVVMIVV